MVRAGRWCWVAVVLGTGAWALPDHGNEAGESPPPVCCRSNPPAYLHAGAPSETAIPFGSAAKFTYTAHFTMGVWRLRLVDVALLST